VDFAKQLPGFLQLSREDQIALLKTSAIEVMLLETSRRYNPGSESITFLKDFSYNRGPSNLPYDEEAVGSIVQCEALDVGLSEILHVHCLGEVV
ncbi:hypothetical protein NPN18_24220, partial [Vibrio parahaemolyticus]|nr:hypothetical protein [Vibrio parahaemolyticus]